MTEKPTYYAIIPAEVRYSDIIPNAKLLYGEITALSNKDGFCWAANSYFAKLYDKNLTTISEWVSILEKNGFIKVETDGKNRKIYLREKPKVPRKLREKPKGPSGKAEAYASGKAEHNNTSVNNTIILSEQSSEMALSRRESETQIETVVTKKIPPPNPPQNFSMDQTIAKMSDGKDHDKIMAVFWSLQGFVFENSKQYRTRYARDVKSARKLADAGYSGADVCITMEYCKDKFKDPSMWTLETVEKQIAKVINIKK